MRKWLEQLKNVKGSDLIAGVKFLLMLLPALCFTGYLKIQKKFFWLICEEEFEARDNGFALFKYIRQNHPDVCVYYAINPKSADYEKVRALGPVIPYGTCKHWLYYLAAEANISSQKGGKPNAAVCYALEVYGLLRNQRFFLQHGVILNDTEFLHYENTKMRLFVCGAYPEYEYVRDTFGYPKDYVQYLGLCRFDDLHRVEVNPKQIVIMPTWRNWFRMNSKSGADIDSEKRDFRISEYYRRFQSLINNPRLAEYLESHDLKLVFYPHRNMQGFISYFSAESKNVIVADSSHYDLQKILRESSLMVTDYSSVSMDFAYMKKPVIYYQFDQEKFRKYQYKQGYFSYENNGFGPVYTEETRVVDAIIDSCEKHYAVEEVYIQRHHEFFVLYDENNCQRNYQAIRDILDMGR
jgi:hypothetical protein